MNNLYVRLVDLPYTVQGMTVRDSDGNYNVYINSRIAYNAQKKAFIHEMEHIKRKHFNTSRPVRRLESEIDIKPDKGF